MPTARELTEAAVVDLIVGGLDSVLAARGTPAAEPLTGSTRLIGRGAAIDSIGLVTLLVDLEQTLEDEWEVSITVADERAMSQRHSPFRTVETLAAYAWGLIREETGNG